VQRALELHCDAILAAKHGVDGVFTADPKQDRTARRYSSLSFDDVIRQDLRVMDQSAMLLARDHRLPVHLFNFDKPGAIRRICLGEDVGTTVTHDAPLRLVEDAA
jgi:uridylate kinase